jgi:hypothetical protein
VNAVVAGARAVRAGGKISWELEAWYCRSGGEQAGLAGRGEGRRLAGVAVAVSP